MIHLGDITKINGAAVEPVDCVTFGSPCQDLSIAGKRAGLAGERSGLFMEATRIIKEMRGATNGRYPTFAIWENVVGAYSSNNGEDFRAVLEELARCVEPGAVIPGPVKGKWTKAGCIAGDGWSVAWRTFDAQYWGVPQRRRRIAAVLDLRGQRAGEILFEREGLPGNTDKSIPTWKGSARNPQAGAAGHDRLVDGEGSLRAGLDLYNGRVTGEICNTFTANSCLGGSHPGPYIGEIVPYGIGGFNSGAWLSNNPKSGVYEAETARTLDRINCGYPGCNQGGMAICEPLAIDARNGRITEEAGTLQSKETGGYSLNYIGPCMVPVVYDARGNGDGSVASTLTGDHENRVTDYTSIIAETFHCSSFEEVSPTLKARDYKDPHIVTSSLIRWIVRRLTPRECERLQGFPDDWTQIGEWYDSNGKLHKESDSPRYKALGNSIALPQWWWLTCKIAPYLGECATLASLFDGIGGFPLVWETYHGAGTARWASEIEEFPIAVTKLRFPEPEFEMEDWM